MPATALTATLGGPIASHDGKQHAIQRLRSVTIAALVLPVLLFVVISALLYRQQFRDARQTLEGHSRIAQEHALKLLETNEMLLERMLDLVDDVSDEQLLARSEELHRRLKAMSESLPQVRALFINGADSRSLASTVGFPPRRDLLFVDRAWYQTHRAGTSGTYISELLVGRSTGELIFDVNRRRSLRDGSFGGTVHVNLRPGYLMDFYKELEQATPGLRLAMIRSDGQVLARWPGELNAGLAVRPETRVAAMMASGSPAGYIDFESPFETGKPRVTAYRKLDDYPIYVWAGMEQADVLAAWWRQVGLMALFLVPTSLAFAAMAWSALQRTQREFAAVQRLEQEMAHRHRIETALLTAQKLEAMGRLTGGVAHDFNNLLMIMNTTLYLHKRLHPHLADDKQLAAMERAIGSGTKLTRQLLAFARKQALRPERTELSTRLPELLALIKPVVGPSVDVLCDVVPGTGAIDVDAAELELAMINLAVNARDAMQGAGRLAIRACNPADDERPPNVDGELVMIEVTDSGGGIDPSSAARLFEPFFTTKPLGQGTGLGLAQVQTLCHSAGGVATIDNAPGGGARVRLYFARSAAPAAAEVREPPRTRSLECRVLLVEDNDAVAEATAELLRSIGCSVERVAHAQAALDRLDAPAGAPVEVVLSDIEMPGALDGVALASRLSQRSPPLPIVLMTGYAARLEQALREGLHVLPKPCSPEILAAAIGRAQKRAVKEPPILSAERSA
jgi:two-component system NtrC family sensor kinase